MVANEVEAVVLICVARIIGRRVRSESHDKLGADGKVAGVFGVIDGTQRPEESRERGAGPSGEPVGASANLHVDERRQCIRMWVRLC